MRRRIKRYIRKHTKQLIVGGAAVLFASLVTALILLYLSSDRLGTALDSKRFDTVQVAVTQTVTGTDEETGEEIEETTDLGIIQKNGSTICEYGEAYRYERDGEAFYLYCDNTTGQESDDGVWTEIYAKNLFEEPAIDFTDFDNYEASDFMKIGEYYTPKDYEIDVFYDFLQIDYNMGYYMCEIRFYVAKGRVNKMEFIYEYMMKEQVVITYQFTYDDVSIQVPQADVRYDRVGNLIEEKERK